MYFLELALLPVYTNSGTSILIIVLFIDFPLLLILVVELEILGVTFNIDIIG